MSTSVDSVVDSLAEEVTPDESERAAMWDAVADLTGRTEAAIADRGADAAVLHVGSTARSTWLAGERDIDLFVRFPPGTDRDTLTEEGLAIGRAVLDDGEASFAEHPYITGSHDGFAVDIVPCVAVEAATAAETAVDRTPFHNAYVTEHLTDSLAADVRVAKHVLSGIDAYGSDLKTRGFGGYLLELLVLEHGGAAALFEAAASWTPPVRFDPADHGQRSFDDPLVVIDPTDPTRNVAAVTAAEQLARVQHYSRQLIESGTLEAVSLPEHEPISEADLVTEFEDRGTAVTAIVFDRPDLVDDQLWPQLRKTRSGIRDELDRRGFGVLRSAIMATDDRIALVFECLVDRLPRIERHEGPPVAIRDHADRFVETYRDAEVYGPFIEDDRYVVERPREVRTPRAFLASDRLFDVRIGDQLVEVFESGTSVLVDEGLTDLLPEFGEPLAAYFDPVP